MINIITEDNLITPQEKEELFLQFMHSYLTFLIYICRYYYSNRDEKCNDSQQIEFSLIDSLTLMWQSHVAAFSLKTYYKRLDYEHGTDLTFNREQSKLVVPKLRELKMIINYYPFTEKTNKLHCLSLLKQTQHYYEFDKFVIVDANLHADPWLASHLSQYSKSLERCHDKSD